MIPILQGLFTYILEKFFDNGADRLASYLLRCHAQKQLKKTDEETRMYLTQHLQASDYETVDAYLAKNGIYASDDLGNTTLVRQMVEKSIHDFYRENPDKSLMTKEIEPMLRQALERSFRVLLGEISPGERFLAQQNNIRTIAVQDGLREICSLLRQNNCSHQVLLPEQVEHFCEEVNKAIDVGAFSVAKSCLELMKTQVDSKEYYRWIAARIRLDAFLYDSGNAYHFCERFLENQPDQNTVEDLVTFLISIDDFTSLKIICPMIQTTTQAELLKIVLKQDMGTLLTNFFDQEMRLKPEYVQNKWILWAFGNMNLTCGSGYNALSCYEEIEKYSNESIWLQWKKCCAHFRDSNSSVPFPILSTETSKLDSILQDMFNYSEFFNQTGNDILSRYIEILFDCALSIPGKHEKLPWDRLSDRAKHLSIAQKYRYQERLNEWESIDSQELRNFCKREGYDDLWANYLIYRAKTDGNYVLSELKNDGSLFHKTFHYVIAYAYAINSTKGIEEALDTVKGLIPLPSDEIPKAIFMAYFATQFHSPQSGYFLDHAFEVAVPQAGDRIYPRYIWTLVRMLLDAGRDQDALVILERYQFISPALDKLRLNLMLGQDGMETACNKMLDELSKRSHANDPYLLYCQGVLREKESPGTGCDFFQKSFDLAPGLVNATALLAARINRHDIQKDQVLDFCEHQEEPYAQYLCGCAYLQMGNREQGLHCMFHGLLLCGSSMLDDLCLGYIDTQLHSQGHKTPPEMVDGDMGVILKNQMSGEKRCLWLHNDISVIPDGGSNFAGYEHISSSDPVAITLFHRRLKDTVSLDDGQTYSISAINYGDVIAFQYCITHLARNGQIFTGKIVNDDPQETIAELLTHLESGFEAKHRTKDLYINRNPGLTLQMFQSCIGYPYYESIQSIFWDQSIPFWAGNDHSKLQGDCLLTASTLAILGALGIQPPGKSTSEFTVWITPLTFREVLDEIRQFQQSPQPAGAIGKDANGQVYFIESTEEVQKMQRDYYACIRKWCDYAQKTMEVAPKDYPEDLRKVQKAFHSSEIEAITLATSAQYVIMSDDLLFRQYLHASSIPNASAVELLAEVVPDAKTLLNAMSILLRCDYRDPITDGLLQKLSQFFSMASSNEHELADVAEQTISLVKQYVKSPYTRYLLFSTVQHLLQKGFQFQETLLWIMAQALYLFVMEHPELVNTQSSETSS